MTSTKSSQSPPPAPTQIDVRAWVADAADPRDREFRQCVHTILHALSTLPEVTESIALKGAVLLSLKYQLTRATRDIDFSTEARINGFDVEAFVARFRAALTQATDALPYGLVCNIQKHEIDPPRVDATWPTLRVNVGYAPALDRARMRKLRSDSGTPTLITFELSFNEPLVALELLALEDNEQTTLRAYALSEFVAEKFRAMIQQPIRQRARPQDALDLYTLLQREPNLRTPDTMERILETLVTKSTSRNITVTRESLQNPDIRRRSSEGYVTLASSVAFDMPSFETVYPAVADYYESLPWKF